MRCRKCNGCTSQWHSGRPDYCKEEICPESKEYNGEPFEHIGDEEE